MDYRRPLNAFMEELRANPAVDVEAFSLGRGLPPDEVRALAQRHRLSLPDTLVDFFTQINGAVIRWRLAPAAARRITLRRPADADSIGGSAYFYTLAELAPEWTSLRHTPFEEGLADGDRLHAFRPFDQNVEEAFAGFMAPNGRVTNEVFYLRQYKELIPLNVDLDRYLQALIECKAYLWWQDAFAAWPGGRIVDMYYYVPQLFAGATLERLR